MTTPRPTRGLYCCGAMREQVEHACSAHPDPHACPDKLIRYVPELDEYGIVVHDGGSASVSIRHCPWCGTRLPESKRDRWFEELKRLGFPDPWDDLHSLPENYRTDEWYQP